MTIVTPKSKAHLYNRSAVNRKVKDGERHVLYALRYPGEAEEEDSGLVPDRAVPVVLFHRPGSDLFAMARVE